MSSPFHVLRHLLLLPIALGALAGIARADLVWSRETGWRVEGGVMSGLTGASGRDALDLMNKARLAEENRHAGAALKAYAKVTKKYATSIYAPEAYYHTAKIYLGRREYFKAFEAYQEILARYPNTRRFNEVIEREYSIASRLLDGAHNHVWGWLPGFADRGKAVQYMSIIVSNAPYNDYAPLALMACAEGEIYLGDTEEAIDTLDRVINNYPQSVLAPEAYLKLSVEHARLVEGPYYDQSESKLAVTYDEDFMILYPSDPKIAAAANGLDQMKKMLALSKVKIGDFYFYKRDDYTAARVFYNEAITSYPDSDVAKLARTRLGQVEAKANAAANSGSVKKKHFLVF
jgi:outer membrane protein assembly factor BamD